MHPPLNLSILSILTILLLSRHIHALTLTHPLTLTPPLAHQNTCIPKRTPFTSCPDYYDCLRAIFALPDLQGEGAFHNGAPDDVFRLPVEETRGSCRVRVELRHEGSARQGGSWHVIVARALRLGEE